MSISGYKNKAISSKDYMVKITKDAIFNVLGERLVLKANEIKNSKEFSPDVLENLMSYGYLEKIKNNSPVKKNGRAVN